MKIHHNIKFLIIFFIIFFNGMISMQVMASGDVMGNGGGLAEQNVTFAFKNLGRLIEVCLISDDCRLNGKEENILNDIKSDLDDVYQNTKLIFVSESDKPGTFLLNGELKIAKTYLYIGAPIFINTDLLYQKNSAGKLVPYSMMQATALLIHELGHQNKYTDHTELDLLGSKVAMLVDRQVDETRILPGRDNLKIKTINFLDKKSHPIVLLYVGDKIINLSDKIKNEVSCSLITLPFIGPVHWNRKKPNSTVLHNLSFVYQNINDHPQRHSYFSLKGALLNFCENTNGKIIEETASKLTIDFSAKLLRPVNVNGDINWEINLKSLSIKQVKDSWWHFFNLPII